MENHRRSLLRWFWLAALFTALGCTVRSVSPNREPLSIRTPPPETDTAETGEGAVNIDPFQVPEASAQPSSARIPIESGDPVWGSPTAPITIVEFSDLQCPFCLRVMPTIAELQKTYGPEQLRLVWKHNPLPFHQRAKPAALLAHAVQLTSGSQAFFRFIDAVFAEQSRMGDHDLVERLRALGLNANRVVELASSPDVKAKIERDVALAQELGATGTPAFFVNGIKISGAQPLDNFKREIDAELARAAELTRSGARAEDVYGLRVATNSENPPKAPDPPKAEDDLKAWRVPVTGAPSQGPADALVTIVAFYDYQCPFCLRVQETIQKLRDQYPKDVRIVVRHNPLPFHLRARAAATLVIEARAQRGDAAFFEATRLVLANQKALEDDDLLKLAAELKLNPARVKRALAKDTHKKVMDGDQMLAAGLEARGTPYFFINGVRLSGAQPLERFVEAVERERENAQALVDEGIPRARVYAELMKTASEPAAPERKELPAPSAANPSRGPAKAPLVVQIFSDFQCPFCRRVLATLTELEQRYPKRVRLVWYNLPLAFHKRAKHAARAALEARAQKGDAAFWKMHDLLFENQAAPDGLEDPALTRYAVSLGLDVARFEAALRDGRHDAAIDADLDVARQAGISGTPSFAINGYFLSGAQPLTAFTRVAEYALKNPHKPAPKAKSPAPAPKAAAGP